MERPKKTRYIYVIQHGDSFNFVEGFYVQTTNLGFYTTKKAALEALNRELNYFWRYDSCVMVLRNKSMISCKCMDPKQFRVDASFQIIKQPLNTRCEQIWGFLRTLKKDTVCDLSSIKGTISEEEYGRRFKGQPEEFRWGFPG